MNQEFDARISRPIGFTAEKPRFPSASFQVKLLGASSRRPRLPKRQRGICWSRSASHTQDTALAPNRTNSSCALSNRQETLTRNDMYQSENALQFDSTTITPAVCRAGYLQFAGNRTFTNPCVQSRAFFWCKSGKGTFTVNNTEYHLGSQDLYLLPWNRYIRYHPDKSNPMFTGHVHLVPHYQENSEWLPNVPHQHSDPAFDSPDRSDFQWPDLDGVVHFKINAGDSIALLLDYTIRSFLRSKGSNESEARQLGCLLAKELIQLKSKEHGKSNNHPEELVRLIAHVEATYMQSITVTDLADSIGRSRSHVLKLFRKHMGISPKHYINKRQLKQACELLLSTTIPIGEVGQAVGVPDPFHFSKLFRKNLKVTPTAYRLNHGPVYLGSENNS